MAYERLSDTTRKKGEGLDVFVDGVMKLYQRQLTIRNAEDELRFNSAVLEQNISLDDQLEFRKKQLKRVSDDPTERKRISEEVSVLKDLVEQKTFADAYLDKLISFEAGVSSVDSIISWLENEKAGTSDQNILNTINQQLLEKKREKFTITQNIIKNQTEYALNDRTDSILDTQIARVGAARNEAMLSGNNDLVSIYDLHLQALNKAKNENSVSKDIQNFATSTITGYTSAVGLLDAYNSKINSSLPTGPITVGNVTYNSPREFWTYRRDSYLADSSGSGFFGRLNSEKDTDIKVKQSKNILQSSDINKIATEYDTLAARSELAPYQFNLTAAKQSSIQTGTDYLSQNILNRYSSDLDLNKALTNINSLKTLGGNVEDAYTSLMISGAETKTKQVSGILSTAQDIIFSDPNISSEEAISKAIAQGAGAVLSPEQLATTKESDIATQFAKGQETGAFTPDVRTTAPPSVTPTPPPPVVPTTTPAPTPTPPITLNRQFDLGTSGADVKELQKFLNAAGFQIASAGPGSPGQETEYYGPLTQAAVQKFQAAQGIVTSGDPQSTGYGRVGPQTLKAIQGYKY